LIRFFSSLKSTSGLSSNNTDYFLFTTELTELHRVRIS
jgi:hypothetical protein